MKPEDITIAANLILESRKLVKPLSSLPIPCQPTTIEDGYRIQHALKDLQHKYSKKSRTGYKIGCTTDVMQNYLSIDHPCAGNITGSSIYHKIIELDHFNYVHPGVECEIVARLGIDIPNTGINSPADVAPYVSALMIGIEIVDNRYTDFRSLGVPTLLADDFFNAGCVLGYPVKEWRQIDICDLKGGLIINGTPGPEGNASDILGHPLAALVWLVKQKATLGQKLKANDFVMLGSLVKTHWFDSPGSAIARIPQLGEVSVVFK